MKYIEILISVQRQYSTVSAFLNTTLPVHRTTTSNRHDRQSSQDPSKTHWDGMVVTTEPRKRFFSWASHKELAQAQQCEVEDCITEAYSVMVLIHFQTCFPSHNYSHENRCTETNTENSLQFKPASVAFLPTSQATRCFSKFLTRHTTLPHRSPGAATPPCPLPRLLSRPRRAAGPPASPAASPAARRSRRRPSPRPPCWRRGRC